MPFVLDSGGVTRLSERTQRVAAIIAVLKQDGLWPPIVPSIALVECLRGNPRQDARANAFLKTCDIKLEIGVALARRAARLRTLAGRGSAVDAVLVATAEPDGTVFSSDNKDVEALAAYSHGVGVTWA